MATYECQNFQDGQVLTAACLNKIEKALEGACNKKVTSAFIDENGNLKIIFADETELDCGCVASSGKGIESVVQTEDGALTFTYADGTIYVVKNVGGGAVTDEQIERAVENYLAENPIGGSEQIQSDYTQNDSTAKDYIKNRPFYEDEPIPIEFPLRETLLEQQTLSDLALNEAFGAYAKAVQATFNFIVGKTYTVVWDNEEYPVVAQDTSALIPNTTAVGNGSAFGLAGNNEPFAIVNGDGYITVVSLTDTQSTPHDVAIYKDPVFAYEESNVGFVSYVTISPEQLALWNGNDWQNCKVVWDGSEHICEPKEMYGGLKGIGNVEKRTGTGDSGEPFAIVCLGADVTGTNENLMVIYDLVAQEGDTVEHEISLFLNQPYIKKIDKKFLPDDIGGGLPEVATSIDLSKFDSDGIIEETYASGTKTTTVEFDASGNPTKITDGNGNVTTLTW